MSSMVSPYADYAVRAMLAIAAAERDRAAGEDRVVKSADLATAQAVPHSFLQAILTELRLAGLLRGHRGSDGGFSLAYPASEITVGAVLRAVAGPLVTVRGLPADRATYHGVAAGLTDVWRAVNAAIEAVVDRTSLADLLAASQPPAGRQVRNERHRAGGGQRGCQASGTVMSRRTRAGNRPLTSWARVTSSTTERTAARTATQNSDRCAAAPS